MQVQAGWFVIAVADMCVMGMRADTGDLQGPARKVTKILSNSQEVLKRVAVSCPYKRPNTSKHHFHVPLESGRARRCQIYPVEFRRQVCKGIAAEKRLRRVGMVWIHLVALGSKEDGRKACDDLHETDGTLTFADQSSEPPMPA